MRIHKEFEPIVCAGTHWHSTQSFGQQVSSGGLKYLFEFVCGKTHSRKCKFFKVLLLASFGSFDFWSSMVSRNSLVSPKNYPRRDYLDYWSRHMLFLIWSCDQVSHELASIEYWSYLQMNRNQWIKILIGR